MSIFFHCLSLKEKLLDQTVLFVLPDVFRVNQDTTDQGSEHTIDQW